MTIEISSTANPKIKEISALLKNNQKRKKEHIIIVEGLQEINAAIEAGFAPLLCFICRDIFNDAILEKKITQALSATNGFFYEVTKNVYQALAYRTSQEGIIATFGARYTDFNHIKLPANPFIIVLEAVEKPGNLGAVLRTADACGANALIICEPLADIYNPNVIRSSVGCVFYQQIVACTTSEAIQWLKEKEIATYAAALTATKSYCEADYTKSTAIVFGSEAIGLSKAWLDKADTCIKIPMLGKTDSLNVSASTAIVAYEVVRQRML